VTRPFHGNKKIDLVTLTLLSHLFIDNFNIGFIFDWQELGLWHFTWVDLVTRPVRQYQKIDLVTLTLVFDVFIKNFNHGHNSLIVSNRAFIFLWQDLSVDTNIFDLVTLALVFDLLFENFILGYIFWVVGTRALWHFSWVFVLTNPFSVYQQVWPCDLYLYVWLI
jgi:hypothetical protein